MANNQPAILSAGPTPTPQSFTQKLIEIDITLGPTPGVNQPRQFSNGQNTVTLKGFRTSVRVQNSGTPKGTTAQIAVYGLTPNLMDELSTLGLAFQLVPQNVVTVRVGDVVSGVSTIVYIGTIWSATADFNQSPNVAFNFECVSGLTNAVSLAKPSSFPQATDVGTIMSGLASKMGLGFENNGVSITLPPSYYAGSYRDQALKVAQDAGIQVNPDAIGVGNQLVLAIWPKGGARSGAVPLVSPSTGMINYPSYTAYGILVKTIFNPNIGFGGQINVESSLPRATGTWVVLRLDHALDSLLPSGSWESSAWCFNPKYPLPVVPAAS